MRPQQQRIIAALRVQSQIDVMICGLLPIDQGEIKVCGQKVTYGHNQTNKFIGYLPDVPAFYDYMTSYDYLKLCGELTGMSKAEISVKSEELLELVGHSIAFLLW